MAWIHGGREVALAVIAGAALGTSRRFPRLTWLVVAGVTLVAAADDSLLGGEEFIAYALIPAHAFLAGTIEVTQIRAHQSARSRNFSGFRQQVDMEMRDAPWLSGNFTPAVHQYPPNETT